MRRVGEIDRKTSAFATMLAFVFWLGVTGFAEAATPYIVPLDRSESIHQYSDQYQLYTEKLALPQFESKKEFLNKINQKVFPLEVVLT